MQRGSIGHFYDAAMDPLTWKGYNPRHFKPSNDPIRRALTAGKSSAQMRRLVSAARKKGNLARTTRQDAEDRAVETVRQAVAALEMAMHELMHTPAPSKYDSHINQKQVLNAIFHLKTKCGIHFEGEEFSSRVPLAG